MSWYSPRASYTLMRPRASTCAPARGVKPTSMLLLRNIAQRSCASLSLSEKYQCPEEGCEKFDSSPSTHTTPRPRSSSTRTSRVRRDDAVQRPAPGPRRREVQELRA